MEHKDYVYLAGILLTFLTSLAALGISIKNRRNAIREHLYKEQMQYLIEVNNEFHALIDIYYEITNNINIEDNEEKVERHISNIYRLTNKYDLITPDDIIENQNKAVDCADELSVKVVKGELKKEDILELQNIYYSLIEDIRELMGVDKLSEENKRVHK